MLADYERDPNRASPYVLLEKMKRHPSITPLIDGGEIKECCALLIPEGGFHAITYADCLGPCDHGANVVVYPERVTPDDIEEIFTSHRERGEPAARFVATESAC